jgi:hypothetical protein
LIPMAMSLRAGWLRAVVGACLAIHWHMVGRYALPRLALIFLAVIKSSAGSHSHVLLCYVWLGLALPRFALLCLASPCFAMPCFEWLAVWLSKLYGGQHGVCCLASCGCWVAGCLAGLLLSCLAASLAGWLSGWLSGLDPWPLPLNPSPRLEAPDPKPQARRQTPCPRIQAQGIKPQAQDPRPQAPKFPKPGILQVQILEP